jgi:diguanylate cyclase
MLWKRKKSEEPAISIRGAETSEADKALDTVINLLRTYGQYAFDTDEFEAEQLRTGCDQWASRILVGAPKGEAEDDAAEGPRSVARDWSGLRLFVRQHREIESAYVGRSMGNLRQAIQSFAQCLSSAVREEKAQDRVVESQVAKLTSALSRKDTEQIRSCAAELVGSVRDAIQKRRVREQEHMKLLSERLSSLRGELTQARAEAQTDALTRLSNRAAFDEQVERLADLGLLFAHPPCLLMLDLDHFKSINDDFGHPGGDAVLVETAACLMRTFLRKQDFVARYGGEEFAVLLVDTPAMQVKVLAERACEALRSKAIPYQGKAIFVTMSVGIATLAAGETSAAWLRRADAALYAAKSAGRDRVVLSHEEEPVPSARRLSHGSSGNHRAVRR